MEIHERRRAHIWICIISSLVLILFVLDFAKLTYLHFFSDPIVPRYERKDSISRIGLRGKILDRNGNVLVESIPGAVINIDTLDEKLLQSKYINHETLPYEVAQILGVDEDILIKAYNTPNRRNLTICTLTDEKRLETLKQRRQSTSRTNQIAGVGINYKDVRSYPNGRRLCHVLGFLGYVGDDPKQRGSAGLELKYDSFLCGVNGYVRRVVNSRNVEIRELRKEDVPEIHGSSVHLTIDNNIQYFVETALDEALEKHNSQIGTIIVQRVHTGEILAMASRPDFDPQVLSKTDPAAQRNIAISYNFEPGSVMKSITVAVGLQYGVINPSTSFNLGNGSLYYAGRVLKEHGLQGVVSLKTILQKSSNIGTAQIGLLLAEPSPMQNFPNRYQRFDAALRSFGFGSKLGVDLPGEETGLLASYKNWEKIAPTRVGMGQGVSVTALQMINAYSTLANGGKLMQPYIVKKIVSSSGVTLYQKNAEIIRRPISENVANKVTEFLQSVVEPGGTARRAAVKNYTVAGKTGTAQMLEDRKITIVDRFGNSREKTKKVYSQTKYNATFIGYLPATRPEIAILVTIVNPQPEHQGGRVCAPVFAEIAEKTMLYLRIPADAVN